MNGKKSKLLRAAAKEKMKSQPNSNTTVKKLSTKLKKQYLSLRK